MVNYKAITSAVALAFAVSVSAEPVAREYFISHPIAKKSSKSFSQIVASNQARLAKYNGSGTFTNATIINESESYIAEVEIGTQTVSTQLKCQLDTN